MVDINLNKKVLRSPFALKDAPENFTLYHLFKILNELPEPELIGELSVILREELRKKFPQGTENKDKTYLNNGLHFMVDLGDIFGAEFYSGYFNEAPLLNAFAMSLPEKCKVIDVGANFGLFALHAAHVGGPQSKVVAFEPHPSAHDLCGYNIKSNDYENRISLVQEAVGAKVGKSTFFVAKDSAFSGFHDTKRSNLDRKITVTVTTLDENPLIQPLGGIDFLKIDVEGHEGDVLAGAANIIDKSPNLLICLEYSHKNLTRSGKKKIITQLDLLLESGFNLHLFRNDTIEVIERVDEIPKNFSGTLILAKQSCGWYIDFCSNLNSTEENSLEKLDVNLASFFLERLKTYRHAQSAIENVATSWGLDSVDQAIYIQIKNKFQVFSKEKVTHEKEIEALERQLNQSREKNQALETMFNTSKVDAKIVQKRIVELQRENTTLKDMLQSKSTDVRLVSDKLSQSNESLKEFRNQLSKMKAEMKSQTSKNESSASEQAGLNASLKKMLNASKVEAKKVQEKRAELKKENVTLKDMLQSKSTDVRLVRDKLTQSNESLQEFRRQLSKVEAKLKSQTSKNESSASEQAALNASLKKMLNTSKVEAKKVQEKRAELKKENTMLKDMLQSKSTDVRLVRDKLTQSNESLQEFRRQLSKVEAKLKSQTSKNKLSASEQAALNTSLKKMLNASKVEAKKAQKKIVELRMENIKLKDMLQSKSTETKQTQEKKVKLQEVNQALKEMLSKKTDTVQSLRRSLKSSNMRLEEFHKHLAKKQSKIDKGNAT